MFKEAQVCYGAFKKLVCKRKKVYAKIDCYIKKEKRVQVLYSLLDCSQVFVLGKGKKEVVASWHVV